MHKPRLFTAFTFALMFASHPGIAAAASDDPQADQAILQQAANAMLFQTVFADMAMALSTNTAVVELGHHIHDLSSAGLQHILQMAEDCGVSVEAHLDGAAWRRIRALREVSTAILIEQMYLDTQLMRLYEARQENLDAMVRAQHEIVQAFTMRSEPEIEKLILIVRAVRDNWPTLPHKDSSQ